MSAMQTQAAVFVGLTDLDLSRPFHRLLKRACHLDLVLWIWECDNGGRGPGRRSAGSLGENEEFVVVYS
jgi:hypothetical protein